jgi:uncharacterized protein (TIGR03118 family)
MHGGIGSAGLPWVNVHIKGEEHMPSATGFRDLMLMTAFGVGTLVAVSSQAKAGPYAQTNLVSDISGLAQLTDPALKNPWGASETTTSPFWVSDQATGQSTLYTVQGTNVISESALTVTTASPTGQVANTTSGFVVNGTTSPASFIFANLNGTITAWNGTLGHAAGTPSAVEATVAGASYTGLAIDNTTQQIYAANDKAGTIDVFNSSFTKETLPVGAFVDPNLPSGLVPFNVQEINGQLYVTYAPSGRAAQTTAGAGSGVVAVFSTNGTFVSQLISGSALASPWGLALAPAVGFGVFSGDLLVGNFSFDDSEINAFNPTTGAFLGSIPIDVGAGDTAGGLWDLTFGNGGSGGSPDVLYFTDGINGEADGLFGAISAVPEPSSLLLLVPGLAFIAARRRPVRLLRG